MAYSSVVEEVKNRIDLVDIVSETVSLRKAGKSYTGFCPFHSNTRTPSFVVFPDTQTWRCFGACADGGDLFSYVMKRDGLDFKEALTTLAARAGVTLEEATPEQIKHKERRTHLVELLDAAAAYFHQLFLHAPQAQFARAYSEKRGFTAETVETYSFGFALDSFNAARDHFMAQGYSEDDLLAVGLMTENPESGRRYDRFRNRLIIPIRDASGDVVGFGARTLDPDGIPKYLNSPQTEVFDKSNLLFGLDMSKRHIREARQAVIVEGYMDVIMAWQGGFRNVIAQMGTALTKTQLELLKRYTKRFVIALDSDAAGVKATLRSLEVARETLDRGEEIQFDPTGLLREEGRLQADIRVATMPPGEDPDSIIRKDPALFAKLIAGAKGVVEYVLDALVAEYDLSDVKNKTTIAERIIPLIQDISNPVERDHYWQLLARTLQVDDRSLRQMYVPTQRSRSQRPSVKPPQPAYRQAPPPPPPQIGHAPQARPALLKEDPAVIKERYFLRICLQDPMLIRQVNRLLSQVGQAIVHAEDFSSAVDRSLFIQLNRYQSTGLVASPDDLWDSLDSTLLSHANQLNARALSGNQQTPDESRIPEDLKTRVLNWRSMKLKRAIDQLKVVLRESQDRQVKQELTRQSIQYNKLLIELQKAISLSTKRSE